MYLSFLNAEASYYKPLTKSLIGYVKAPGFLGDICLGLKT